MVYDFVLVEIKLKVSFAVRSCFVSLVFVENKELILIRSKANTNCRAPWLGLLQARNPELPNTLLLLLLETCTLAKIARTTTSFCNFVMLTKVWLCLDEGL